MKIALIALMALAFFIAGCANNPGNPDPINSQDFEFTYSFGVGSGNTLDTQTNTYTKDMVCEDYAQYIMELSGQEKQAIAQKINETNLLAVKSEFTQNCNFGFCQDVTPLSGKDLTIKTGNQTKTITYRANYYNANDPELAKYLEVTELIEQIILQNEQELGIPQPTCGYM